MPNQPLFMNILRADPLPDEQAIRIFFLGADDKKYEAKVSMTCAGALIAAVAANLGRLVEALPPDSQPPIQPIRCIGTQTAMKDDGSLALFLRLEDGAEVALEFAPSDLSKISAQFEELAKLADPNSRH